MPAFRASGLVAATVAAILAQTHAGLRLLVGIDPAEDDPGSATLDALAPALGDLRVDARVNPTRLG